MSDILHGSRRGECDIKFFEILRTRKNAHDEVFKFFMNC